MAIGKIESSGCTVRHGKIQLRFSFYLEPDDPRYEEHYVQVLDPTSKKYLIGYKGKLDRAGSPVDQADYDRWIGSLPKIWQNNPFHNHFVYVDADIADSEIKTRLQESLNEFFTVWSKGEDITEYWKRRPNKPKFVAGDMSRESINRCYLRISDIVSKPSPLEVGSL